MTDVAITGSLHLRMVLLVFAIVGVVVVLGVWARRRGRVETLSNALGAVMVLITVLYNAYYFHPNNFRWDVSLPLHVCDVLGLLAAIALFVPRRFAQAVLYFSAIPLAGQAILTPTGNQDPEALRFWLYWTLHAGILATSIYDIAIRRYRPSVRDYVSVLTLGVAYVAVILPIDVWFGWNYGYLGNTKPDTVTAIDFLGPWPQRVVLLLFLVAIIQAIMLLPWLALRERRSRSVSSS